MKEKSTKRKCSKPQKQHVLMTFVYDIIKHQTSNVFKTVHLDHELVCPILGRTTCVMMKGLHLTCRVCCNLQVADGRILDLFHRIYRHEGMAQVLVVSSTHDDLILWMKCDYSAQRVAVNPYHRSFRKKVAHPIQRACLDHFYRL